MIAEDAWAVGLWGYTGVSLVLAAGWIAVHRLSWLTSPRTRHRIRLAVSSATGMPGGYVAPVIGTVVYLACGLVAIGGLVAVSRLSLTDVLAWDITLAGVAVTLVAVLGAHSLIGFAMSVVYAVRPTLDIAATVTDVPWIREISALGHSWRWVIPMVSASVEEFFFRGVFLLGLFAAGAPAWWAVCVSGVVFTAGQLAMTTDRSQALIMALSSLTLSTVGGMLVLVEGSVLPAIIVHASFAGYYTQTSFVQGRSSHV